VCGEEEGSWVGCLPWLRVLSAMEKKKKACIKLVEDLIIEAYKFLDEKWSLKFR
jgi:hypothetical protein